MPAESVRCCTRDTDVTPYDMGTLGSRSTFHMGHAVKRAAEDARDKLESSLREAGLPPGSTPGRRAVPEELRHAGGQRDRLGQLHAGYKSPDPKPGCHRTSRRSGWSAAPASRSRSTPRPAACDDAARQRGRRRHADQSAHLRDAAFRRRDHAARLHAVRGHGVRRRPGHQRFARRLQDPRISRRAADGIRAGRAEQTNGPFGAKGMGGSGTFGVSPAIANAIEDAVGVRLYAAADAEAVLRALRAKEGRPLVDE